MFKTMCMINLDYPRSEGSNHSSNKSDSIKGGMHEGYRKVCALDPNVPAAQKSHKVIFFRSSDAKNVCNTDFIRCRCLLKRSKRLYICKTFFVSLCIMLVITNYTNTRNIT